MKTKNAKEVTILELFAGVGGFRVGFDRANAELANGSNHPNKIHYSVVWSNQWEPGERAQYASQIYRSHWPNCLHVNEDISKVPLSQIPKAQILVGGFPCQDYSVARTLNQAAGIVGKKGVLWWQIHKIVKAKRPDILLLENVDRLLNSPAHQRGRDFAIILTTLNKLRYAVEWRVINAADYGFPQRRRRVFVLAYREGTKIFREMTSRKQSWLTEDGVFAQAFPMDFGLVQTRTVPNINLADDPVEVTEKFNSAGAPEPRFQNAGVATGYEVYTLRGVPSYKGEAAVLNDILLHPSKVSKEYFIRPRDLPAWRFLKGAKSLARTKRNGVSYTYDEGRMAFPDPLDKPARTIITAEGGRSPSRFKHVVLQKGKYRRLSPIELELLNGFSENHTSLDGISDTRRAFFMGNALVTGLVTKIAVALADRGLFK